MILLKIAVILICAGLKLWAELAWHNAQRFIMPILLCVATSIVTGVWWLGITILPVIGIIVMGYGEKSWLYKILGDAGARGMWLFLVNFNVGLPLAITGHLLWTYFLGYCLIGGIWGATTRALNNKVIAPITGGLIGSVVFLIH